MKFINYLLIVLFPINLYLLGFNYFTIGLGLATCLAITSLVCRSDVIEKINKVIYFIIMSIATFMVLTN